MADPVARLTSMAPSFADIAGGYSAETAPADLSGVYDYLSPKPGTEYGSILPVAREPTGERRLALPSSIRNLLLGGLDLMAGLKTGELTPRATEAFTALSLPGGAAGFARQAPVPAIRAFHGTPHVFDKFDMSKLGEGQGTQVRGYGHYLSGAVDDAAGYASREGKKRGVEGHVIATDISPDAALFHWESALGQQEEGKRVLDVLKSSGIPANADITGRDAYSLLVEHFWKKAGAENTPEAQQAAYKQANAALLDRGVSGHSYDTGAPNEKGYVVWDDDKLKVTQSKKLSDFR